MARQFRDTVLAFHRACSRLDVPYAFVGGVAVMAWGIPRATADIDAIALVRPEQMEALAEALASEGLEVDARDFQDALADPGHVSVFDSASGFHVDLKLASGHEELEELRDAVVVKLADGEVRVPRPEEVVAFKVRFGSPQDIQDARGILERQGDRLDRARLAAWARRLGVEDALRRLQ